MSFSAMLRQYSLEGIERPAFQQMVFLQDDMVNFADIGVVDGRMLARTGGFVARKVGATAPQQGK